MIPYVTGPVHIYCGIGQSFPISGSPVRGQGTVPVFLGTCETAPRIQYNPGWSPVMNDSSGDQKPYDYLYQGKDAKVFGDLTVWNWPVLEAIMNRPNSFAGGTTFDTELFGDIGTLMVTEGYAYNLWLEFPYGTLKPVFGSSGGMPGGIRFIAAWLIGPDEIDPGTKANKVHIQFHCQRAYDPVTGSFLLADRDVSTLPAFPPVTVTGI